MNILNEERPWGGFRQFTDNEPTTVKTLRVKVGQSLSLQYHKLRREFWHVLSGNPEITIGDKTVRAKVGDEFEIPEQTNHRIRSIDDEVLILEISRGKFEEGDVVRVEDQYGRA